MPSPTLETRTLPELAAFVTAEGHQVDPDDAELIVGWEGAVIRTGDGWIFRFPRRPLAEYHRELAVLERLAGTLPVPTPDVAWTGRQEPFAAYRTLTGADMSLRSWRLSPRSSAIAPPDHWRISLSPCMAAPRPWTVSRSRS